MREQALNAAAIGYGDASRVGELGDSGLEDSCNRMSNTRVHGRVAEDRGAPLLEGFHDIYPGRESENGHLLSAEVHDGNPVRRRTDVPAQAVHGTDCRNRLHDR